jgi:hypothetical protein
MTSLEQRILDNVRESMDADRLEKSIVYLDDDLKKAGQLLHVGDVVLGMPWDGHIAFVDLEPGVNWGHECAYVAVRSDGSASTWFSAQMPPFLKAGGASTFRLLRCGSVAPQWAVAENPK